MNATRKRSLIAIFGWAYLVLFALWFLVRVFWFDANWVIALITDSQVYFVAPVIVLLPLALVKREWWLAGALCVPLALFLIVYAPRFIPRERPAPAETLRVMNFNTLFSNPDLDAFAKSVRAANPDILGLEEVLSANAEYIEANLAAEYPYRVLGPIEKLQGAALLSKYPIEDVEILPANQVARGLRAKVMLESGPIAVYVVHLSAPNMLAYPLAQFGEIASSRYTDRHREVDYIRQELAQRTLPTLLFCDCNASDASGTYAKLASVLSDTFLERGWGLGHTMLSPYPIPTQRFDFIWHTDELTPLNAQVGQDGGSDHLPVVATFEMPLKKQ